MSLLVHLIGGIAASQLAVEPSPGGRSVLASRNLRGDLPPMLLEWTPPSPPPEPPAAAEPPPPLTPIPEPAPEPEPRIRLGITESDQKTDNAMGFADPSPHAGPLSEVDQPALDPQAMPATPQGDPAAAAPPTEPPSPPAQPVEPAPSTFSPPQPPAMEPATAAPKGDAERSQPKQVEQPPGDPLDSPQQPGESSPVSRKPPQEAQVEMTAGRDAEDPGEGRNLITQTEQPGTSDPAAESPDISEFIGPLAEPPPPPRPEVPPAPPTPPTPVGASAPQPPGPVGIQSEKEADPASKTKPVEVILGRPAAAQGLEIITKRPRRNPFSLVTRATAIPESPVLEVKFNRAGTVSKASILKSSGVPDVDSPVLAAVYGWTANGKELAALSPDDPEAGITIRVTILLR